VQVLRGNRERALGIFLEQFHRTPTLDLAARIGDPDALWVTLPRLNVISSAKSSRD
jgi:hypothetical protein